MFLIDKLNYKCEFSFSAASELFDKTILPIITYGSEIWGLNTAYVTESVLITYCRRQLGVGSKTPIAAILGDSGCFPVYIKVL